MTIVSSEAQSARSDAPSQVVRPRKAQASKPTSIKLRQGARASDCQRKIAVARRRIQELLNGIESKIANLDATLRKAQSGHEKKMLELEMVLKYAEESGAPVDRSMLAPVHELSHKLEEMCVAGRSDLIAKKTELLDLESELKILAEAAARQADASAQEQLEGSFALLIDRLARLTLKMRASYSLSICADAFDRVVVKLRSTAK